MRDVDVSGDLDALGGALELGECVNRVLDLLLGALAHLGAYLFGSLWAHERLLLRRLHLPHDNRGLQRDNIFRYYKCFVEWVFEYVVYGIHYFMNWKINN